MSNHQKIEERITVELPDGSVMRLLDELARVRTEVHEHTLAIDRFAAEIREVRGRVEGLGILAIIVLAFGVVAIWRRPT